MEANPKRHSRRFQLQREPSDPTERAVRAAQRAGGAIRPLVATPGWADYLRPYIETGVADATARVMSKPESGPSEQFLEGWAAALTDLNGFMAAILDEERRALQQKTEDDSPEEDEKLETSASRRFA